MASPFGAGTIASHAAMRFTHQPGSLAILAAAGLGVPIAAATIGTQLNLVIPGESAALILGRLVSIVAATIAGGVAVRAGYGRKNEGSPESGSGEPS